jgi:hypothetical protein
MSELTCGANEVQWSVSIEPYERSNSSSNSIIRHVASLIAGLGSMQSMPILRHTLTYSNCLSTCEIPNLELQLSST